MTALAAEHLEDAWYADHFEHLDAELQALDLILLRAVARMRRDGPAGSGAQDVYIGHEEVDRLLDPAGRSSGSVPDAELDIAIADARTAIDAMARHARHHGVILPLAELAGRLGLSPFEYQTLIVCLAPELDRRYDRLYCYLQDDVTRKRPSVDLALRLLLEDPRDRWSGLAAFTDHAPLRRFRILHDVPDPHSPSGSTALATFLRVDQRIIGHILGATTLDGSLAGCAGLLGARPGPALSDPGGRLGAGLARVIEAHIATDHTGLLVHLRGVRGTRPGTVAHAAAATLGTALVEFDVAQAPVADADFDEAVTAAVRDGWLLGVPVLLVDADRIVDASTPLAHAIQRFPAVVIMTGERIWRRWASPIPVHEIIVPETPLAARTVAWERAVAERNLVAADGALAAAASRFRLAPGQIAEAAAEAARRTVEDGHDGALDVERLFAACRAQSSRSLEELAQRLRPVHRWGDLVVGDRGRVQLEEICRQVSLRDRVLDEWGLGRRVAASRGVAALFTGPPGTGKTMAAGVIANELGLDLYRIDLSQVVSKYIGETEKNLARIFAEAQSANAVLFFDEADALFGKRTEIGDAHDRYANIETSYLLQEMERHDGVAILATNFQQNMDEAFLRRLGFVVDFPFPDAAIRREIWARHLDGGPPLEDDIELDELAERLPVSGGNIRNIVLAGAYLAAAEDTAIGMAHLVRAAEREFEKVGKLWTGWEITS